MSKPIAVLISDIHFTLATLDRAAAAFLKAQFKAKILGVPLVVMGDTLDAKRIIAAEVANKLIELCSVKDAPEMIFLVGNHDKLNEKSDEHSLNFLKPYAVVVDSPRVGSLSGVECMMIPYQHDSQVIKNILDDEDHPPPNLLIMHQGVIGSSAGHYIQDKSACPKDWFADYRVISGHYHERQDIKTCPYHTQIRNIGVWSYLGNAYTLGFGEANDPPKGYHILNDDGLLDFVHLELPKHVKFELTQEHLKNPDMVRPGAFAREQDFLWVKVYGSTEELSKLTKSSIAEDLHIEDRDFKLDLIPDETKADIDLMSSTQDRSEILDALIDTLTVTDKQKARLKNTWRDFL